MEKDSLPPGIHLHGVPQGSVLSPILSLLYMVDIGEILEESVFMIVYADDIVVYATDKEDERACQKMIGTLDRIKIWCQDNDLSISQEKCSAINFSLRRDLEQQLQLTGVDIPWSPLVKILGIWITRILCFPAPLPKYQSQSSQAY